jgi:hypothetical protein
MVGDELNTGTTPPGWVAGARSSPAGLAVELVEEGFCRDPGGADCDNDEPEILSRFRVLAPTGVPYGARAGEMPGFEEVN